MKPIRTKSGMEGFSGTTELGFFYRVMERQLGEQLLLAGVENISIDDPTVWETLKLVE